MKRILIIDDDVALREIIVQLLQTHHFEPLEADRGESGIEIARTQLPDLILYDIVMPGMDGYQTLEVLKQNSVTAAIPFIFLTGKGDRDYMRQGMDKGADDYLPKPVTSTELIAAINTRLEKQEFLKREAEKKLSDLRSNVSLSLPHELRTPLVGILGFSEILKDEAKTLQAEEIVEMATNIHKSATRLHHSIENFLVYAQLELIASDPDRLIGLRRSESEEANKLVELLARQIADKYERGSDIVFSGASANPAISTNYLSKMMEEIIDNAFKFSKKGSPVEVFAYPVGESLVLKVQDNGVGMKAEQISAVGAYMQFDRRIREQQGTGLGLVIARQIAELHNGSFQITSQNNCTLVAIALPLAQENT